MASETAYEALVWPDLLVVVAYFAIVLAIGFWASARAKTDNAVGFFLAERNTHWILIGASTFATNVGAPMFLGMAGAAAASGLAITMFEWHAMWMLLLLGWVFLPVYVASGCTTMPEYLRRRYGGKRISAWLAVIHTVLTITSQISGQMYAGAVFVQQIFKWNLYAATLAILAVTGIFTIIGGLKAVIWTDAIQTVIIIGGAFAVSVIAMSQIGSYEALKHQFMSAAANHTILDVALHGNRTCGLPPENSFHIFRSADDPNFPWPGMVFGLTILALNAWCTDQTCVQRSLSARNMLHAKAGVTLAAYLKILPFIFFIIPGMISRVLYPDEVACAIPKKCYEICENEYGCYDIAYPHLVLRILPVGVRGVMVAALLSALVSSLTSIFNSSSTIFTMDIWRQCRRHATERELMVVGRLWVLLLVCVSLLWLPMFQLLKGSQFWAYFQSVFSFLVPPVVMTFLFGIFWTRTTEKGAFWGMVGGFAIGMIRMGLEWSRSGPPCGSDQLDNRFPIVMHVHYLHFAIILSIASSAIIVFVSLLTPPRPPNKLRRVTWWTKHSKELPDLSEDEDDTPEPRVQQKPENIETGVVSAVKYNALKWLCGYDVKDTTTELQQQLTKEDRYRIRLQASSLTEDPFWRDVMNVNGLLCCAVCCFLHGLLA